MVTFCIIITDFSEYIKGFRGIFSKKAKGGRRRYEIRVTSDNSRYSDTEIRDTKIGNEETGYEPFDMAGGETPPLKRSYRGLYRGPYEGAFTDRPGGRSLQDSCLRWRKEQAPAPKGHPFPRVGANRDPVGGGPYERPRHQNSTNSSSTSESPVGVTLPRTRRSKRASASLSCRPIKQRRRLPSPVRLTA